MDLRASPFRWHAGVGLRHHPREPLSSCPSYRFLAEFDSSSLRPLFWRFTVLRTRNSSGVLLRLRGVGLAILSHLVSSCGGNTDAPRPRPNIVLITIDTVRADHLGSYGSSRPSSPSIDQMAESGLLFERALSPAPWTLPSMASLHTSLYPTEHGAIGAHTPLPDDATTVAESLQSVGYETMAFVTHIFVSRRYGLDQGFRTFDESLVGGHETVTSEQLTMSALQYLSRMGREPFFLWVHYFDPHFSYIRHREFGFVELDASPERFSYEDLLAAEPSLRDDSVPDPFSVETVKAIYDEEIAFTDAAIGRLLDGIERLNLARPVVNILTSDHGEYFMERGRFGHGRDVYDELLHVPLIISGDIDETIKGHRFPGAVEMASIAHTIANLAQVDDNPFRGEDLLAIEDREHRPPIFSFGCYAWGNDGRKIMVESEGWKLIQPVDDDRFELYDLGRDPRELDNLWHEETATSRAEEKMLLAALDEFAARRKRSPSTIDLTPEEIRRLEALGYVR
ncbi:MAG TPA: sulfatase [Vicinamibacteria bacterium]|nr:sulfatase [Vicinamibacteria bacterium]